MSLGNYVSTVGSIGNSYMNFMLGGGNEVVTNSIRHSLKNRETHNQSYLKAIYTGAKDGFVRSHHKNIRNGGFFTNFGKNIDETLKCFAKGEGFMNSAKNALRGFNRGIPLFLAMYTVLSEFPNIYRSFRDKGFKKGMKEVIKTTTRMTAAALFATVSSAVIRIPVLSGTYAYFIGDQIGSNVGGKIANFIVPSYTDKKKHAEKKLARQEQQLNKINDNNKQLDITIDNNNNVLQNKKMLN